MNYDNLIKQQVREKCVYGDSYQRVLDLAGPKALSLRYLLQNGNIDKQCQITLIDKRKQNLESASKILKKLGLSVEDEHCGKIETYESSGEYDWVNLDTCSSFSASLGEWISQVKIRENGEVNVWLTCYRANGHFFDSLDETFSSSQGRDVIRCMEDYCIDEESTLSNQIPRNKRAEALVTAAAIATCFNQSFDVLPILEYTAHVNRMYVYRFVNFGCGHLQFPHFKTFYQESDYEKFVNGRSYTKPSVGMNTSIPELCSAAIQKPSYKPYLVKRIRQKVKEARLGGKSAKMVKAGWKSWLTKTTTDSSSLEQFHQLIDDA